MRTHPPLRRLVASVLLPCCLLACSTWKTQDASPQQVLADEQPATVRVILTDGSQLVLEEPTVSGDRLSGWEDGTPTHIPLASVSELELRKGDTVKTIALTAGILVGVAAALALAYVIDCRGGRC